MVLCHQSATACVPAPLLANTALLAAGKGAPLVAASATVAALAQGGGKAMLFTKVKLTAALLALVVTAGGTLLHGQAGLGGGDANGPALVKPSASRAGAQ